MKFTINKIFIFFIFTLVVSSELMVLSDYKSIIVPLVLLLMILFSTSRTFIFDRMKSPYLFSKNIRMVGILIIFLYFLSIFINQVLYFEDFGKFLEFIVRPFLFVGSVIFFIRLCQGNYFNFFSFLYVNSALIFSLASIMLSMITFEFINCKTAYNISFLCANSSFFVDIPSQGVFISGALIFLLHLKKIEKVNAIFFCFTIICFFISYIISGSRSGFVLSLLSLMSYYSFKENTLRGSSVFIPKFFIFISLVILITFFSFLFFPFLQDIFRLSTPTSGRFYMWDKALEPQITFFGHSYAFVSDFFLDSIYGKDFPYLLKGFHSLYMNTYFFYGLLPFLFLIFLIFFQVYCLFKRFCGIPYFVLLLFIYIFAVNFVYSYGFGGVRMISFLSAFPISIILMRGNCNESR